MPATHDPNYVLDDSFRNISTIESHDSMALIGTIQPGIGQPVAAPNTYREHTTSRPNPIKRNRTIRLRGEFRNRNIIGQGAHESLCPKHSSWVNGGGIFPIPTRTRTIRSELRQL